MTLCSHHVVPLTWHYCMKGSTKSSLNRRGVLRATVRGQNCHVQPRMFSDRHDGCLALAPFESMVRVVEVYALSVHALLHAALQHASFFFSPRLGVSEAERSWKSQWCSTSCELQRLHDPCNKLMSLAHSESILVSEAGSTVTGILRIRAVAQGPLWCILTVRSWPSRWCRRTKRRSSGAALHVACIRCEAECTPQMKVCSRVLRETWDICVQTGPSTPVMLALDHRGVTSLF